MHEMSLCESIMGIIEEEARNKAFHKVTMVCLEIGALSHVEPEALKFCFDVAIRGTLAAGARLEIVATPGVAWCMICAKSVTIGQRYDPCPCCGGHQLQVTSGEEMRIKELEVE
ncbi:MAG: hydrogenase maturation nickel metallochaperone HypA [Alphaproteobacteria bacterium]|nr:hydrogenase maturation nickel metallochaperone HypA [Alphaproteobacteria bacterium]